MHSLSSWRMARTNWYGGGRYLNSSLPNSFNGDPPNASPSATCNPRSQKASATPSLSNSANAGGCTPIARLWRLGSGRASSTCTRNPCCAQASAANNPTGPAPTTTTSTDTSLTDTSRIDDAFTTEDSSALTIKNVLPDGEAVADKETNVSLANHLARVLVIQPG